VLPLRKKGQHNQQHRQPTSEYLRTCIKTKVQHLPITKQEIMSRPLLFRLTSLLSALFVSSVIDLTTGFLFTTTTTRRTASNSNVQKRVTPTPTFLLLQPQSFALQAKSTITTDGESTINNNDEDEDDDEGAKSKVLPSPSEAAEIAEHPVLRQVYPDLLAHLAEYGNPNIPLGTSAGKKCSTLRRLYLQKKLSLLDQALLLEIGFSFLSMNDIYHEADFDNMFQRLVAYENETKSNFQLSKKYAPDPELGAWVTNLRRLGRSEEGSDSSAGGVSPEHREQLDAIKFAWKSTRSACGSSFMKQWRAVVEELKDQEQVNTAVTSTSSISISTTRATHMLSIDHLSSDTQNWFHAQAAIYTRGVMGETRRTYMDKIQEDFGLEWKELII
jgi:hypothetical protein